MVWKHRVFVCLFGAASLIVLIAFLRPQDASSSDAIDQIRADRFWIMKAQNAGRYDALIIGDSRSYRGLSPAEMSKMLRGLRIYNLAFSAGGLNPEIYDAASGMLGSNGSEKIMILGITPGSLMESTEGNRKYREEHNRPRSSYLERVYINNRLQRFAPFDLKAILSAAANSHDVAPRYVNRYMDDGWVGSDRYPEDATEELASYREVMTHFRVKATLVQALLEQTRKWTASGINVYGFRPPTSKAMLDLENRMSGFDEQSFKEGFEVAGGKWIPVDIDQYHCYDGSHLSESSAIRLSDYIAAQIARDNLKTLSGAFNTSK
jgi:hypothetical protein